MMRKYLVGMFTIACAVLLASNAMAYTGTYTPGTGINGTVHDLATAHDGMNYVANPPDSGLAEPGARICIFCHAPHNTYKLSPANGGPGAGVGAGPQAPDAFDYLPLWNHELTGNYASFNMYYNGPGAPQVGGPASQAILNGMVPGSTSLLCLSCHDGSVAVNSYGNSAQLTRSISNAGGGTIGVQYVIGKDNYLGNHHPIGFDYTAVSSADLEIRDAGVASFGTAGSVESHLYANKMECGTCHSVHNTGNSGESLLWRSDASSKLCLTCHIKGDDPNAP